VAPGKVPPSGPAGRLGEPLPVQPNRSHPLHRRHRSSRCRPVRRRHRLIRPPLCLGRNNRLFRLLTRPRSFMMKFTRPHQLIAVNILHEPTKFPQNQCHFQLICRKRVRG
jgi:hypothetical protein